MHVTWLISGPLERRDERLYSPMASVRYRVLFVAEHLLRQGHRVDLIFAGGPPDAPDLEAPLAADVVIVSKGLFAGSVAMVKRAKALGARVLMDACDDHFDDQFGRTYLALCKLADGLVANTPTMARVIHQRTGRQADVVDEPFEAPPGEPRFEPQAGGLRLLWFGHPGNIETLATMLPGLAEFSREQPAELHIVSQLDEQTMEALEERDPARLSLKFTTWSPEATWQAIADCDLVLIPSLPSSAKLVKSPNRIVESLRRGRFACAYPLPAYEAFRDYAWLGEHPVDGVRWAMSNRQAVRRQIAAGQQFVAQRFAPERVAGCWESLIAAAAKIGS